MAADRTALTFDVSDFFFRLATESVRLYSNETRQFASLSALVEARARAVRQGFQQHTKATLRGHLETIPSNGPLQIALDLSPDANAALLRARGHLGDQFEASATLNDVLSVLLFDYLVEQRAAFILTKLGVGGRQFDPEEPLPNIQPGMENIYRLK